MTSHSPLSPHHPHFSPAGKYAPWILLVLCCLTLLPFLGLTDFNTKGEPREAVVALSMLEQNNWILPTNNGGEIPYKPPFFHWCVAAASLLNGGVVNEYTSRLPSAIALIAMTMGTYLLFVKRRGRGFALLTALLTFTSLELYRSAMSCRVDMVLTALTVGAIMLLFRWQQRGMRGAPWLAVLCMSCATLTKGPVGILIPCAVAGIYMLLRGVNFWKAFFSLLIWGIVALIIPLAWYYAAYKQGGDTFLRLVMEENFARMTGSMSYAAHRHHWSYNILSLITGWIPWTLTMLLAAVTVIFKHKKGGKPSGSKESRVKQLWQKICTKVKNAPADNVLCATAAIIIFLFYSISDSKRSVYLMPMYPFLGLYVALVTEWLRKAHIKVLRGLGDFLAGIGVFAFICFVAIKFGIVPDSLLDHGKHAADNLVMLHSLRDANSFFTWLCAIAPVPVAIAWWLHYAQLRGKRVPLYLCVIVISIYIALGGASQPALLKPKSAKPVARELQTKYPEISENLYEYIEGADAAKGNPLHFFEINFYLGDKIRNFTGEDPASGYLVISDEDAALRLNEFEKRGYRFDRVYQSPRPLAKKPTSIYKFEKTLPQHRLSEAQVLEY